MLNRMIHSSFAIPFDSANGNEITMEILLKLMSFFVPVTRKIRSEHSGDLELTLIDGKKLLGIQSRRDYLLVAAGANPRLMSNRCVRRLHK
jgi:hypothetical protein